MVFKAPENIAIRNRVMRSVFLAGSIEMGVAELWQDKVSEDLKGMYHIFNPRRDSWDSSWEQSIENSKFSQQVNWELDSLDKADYIIFYFDPKTKSPITLMELGLHANSRNILVCCPEGYWRKGNVDVVCNKYNIPMFETLNDIIRNLKIK